MTAVLWAMIAVPAVAGAALALAGRRAERAAPAVAVGVAVAVLAMTGTVAAGRPTVTVPWVAGGGFGLAVDGLAAAVGIAVAAVSLLVLVFAAADVTAGRNRFFGLMLLFIAAVLLTVAAATLPALLLGWEIMGATSYALIAFRWRCDAAVAAGTTAFLTTRTGDLGLYLAAGAALASAPGMSLDGLASLPAPWRHVAAAGVLAAALGKAAQLPFSFWLSRAMLGPSPVSALLHSAAMVAMGGYLLLRLHPLLAAAGWAAPAAAWAGAATALLLGVVALGQSDLKQTLAASTAAQLGFVVVGAATGAVAGGAAHLIGHAATKALLFLAAGAWLSALGTRKLAALRGAGRRDRTVGAAVAVGAAALGGVPPLALWATKDEVLSAARDMSVPLYAVCLVAAVLASAYAGKVLGVVLRPLPAAPESGYDTEQPGTRRVGVLRRVPLVVLAAGAAVLEILALPPVGDAFRTLLGADGEPRPIVAAEVLAGVLAVAVFAVTAVAAPRIGAPTWTRSWLGLEAAMHAGLVRPVLALARTLARFDDRVLDRAVEGTAHAAVRAAHAAARFDDAGVDGVVARVAAGCRRLGDLARRPQTGQVHQYYAQAIVLLVAAVLVLIVVR
ncbi:proton-conducting transporter transmembrane domain-containing protein [Mangrovihabitans endophyticus]|uniref:NADH:quinone oxidoreductase/Mrp antiporter transmembrane domain-containing protein n=1 Tax=Mangrovihabitans endophyticus TaxID=1751298 RepID=A0A8J3C4H3_9ACTN|nr:proton-conducting transporter membrane subunit [Mangrovihabitans endophyticus]GGL07382.1 hypothetical protein GCM10012284_47100 [Mangrovihabitans endophyticus]